jgi:hypothetical protein
MASSLPPSLLELPYRLNISKKRTRISSENVLYVLCLRSWGLLVDDDDEEVIQIDDNDCILPPFDPNVVLDT